MSGCSGHEGSLSVLSQVGETAAPEGTTQSDVEAGVHAGETPADAKAEEPGEEADIIFGTDLGVSWDLKA